MARNCPDCSVDMVIESVGDIKLDVCSLCAGTWFDPEELRILLARDPLALDMLEDKAVPSVEQKPAGPSWRRCPDCQLPLEEYHYLYTSPVVLNTCRDCGGVWVEDGELDRMHEWLQEINKPMSLKEKAAMAVAEAAIEHDIQMQRQHKLLHFFHILQQYRPGWVGLFP